MRRVGFNAPVAEMNLAAGVGGDVRLMRDKDHGDSLTVEILHETHDLGGGFRIQGAGGFVRQQDAWAIGQSACDGHALLLAAGKLHGAMVHARAEADEFQAFLGASVDVADVLAGVAEGEADVMEGILAGEEG